MRKQSALEALFPETRQAILGKLLLHPERCWYLSDLAAALGRRHPSSLQRELESLVAAQILVRREEGNRVYFQANTTNPIFPELAGLLEKTTGMATVLQAALQKLSPRIKLAFIHGSVARHDERAGSDVDLLIIGQVGLSEVAPALRAAEERLGRAVNAAVYSETEFGDKLRGGHHFLTAVRQEKKIFLIGSQDELEELARGEPGAAPRHQQTGVG
jgi:predicted nucleotidyltransferase